MTGHLGVLLSPNTQGCPPGPRPAALGFPTQPRWALRGQPLAGVPMCNAEPPQGLVPVMSPWPCWAGTVTEGRAGSRAQVTTAHPLLGVLCAGEKLEWVETPSWASLCPTKVWCLGLGCGVCTSPPPQPLLQSPSEPPPAPFFWGMSPSALPAQAKEVPRSSPRMAPGARPQGPWGGDAPRPGTLGS